MFCFFDLDIIHFNVEFFFIFVPLNSFLCFFCLFCYILLILYHKTLIFLNFFVPILHFFICSYFCVARFLFLCYTFFMFTTMQKIDNLISLIREKCAKHVYSFFMPLLTSFLVLLFWFASLQIVGFSVVILLCCFTLIVFDDFLPVVPLMLMLPMCFRDSINSFQTDLPILIILFVFCLEKVYFVVNYLMENR